VASRNTALPCCSTELPWNKKNGWRESKELIGARGGSD
jgi:hypothetical protein